MELTLNREASDGDRTHGVLLIDDELHCHTLEDLIREQPSVPVEQWKVKKKTAIPAGRYRVSLVNSGRFGPGTISIDDVPGFGLIRIHGGNTVEDTEGCPMVGMQLRPNGIGDCKRALDPLKAKVAMAIVADQEVWITINNPEAP